MFFMTDATSPRILSLREQAVLFGIMLLSLAVGLLAPRTLSFLPALTGLLGVIYAYAVTRTLPSLDIKLFGFFAALCLLAAASAFWAPNQDFSLERSGKLAGLFFSAAPLFLFTGLLNPSMAKKEMLTIAVAIICALAGFAIVFEYNTMFALTRLVVDTSGGIPDSIRHGFLINRNTIFLITLALPVLLFLYTSDLARRKKQIFIGLLLASVTAALCYSMSQTAQISALIAILAIFYPAHKKFARRLLMAGVVICMLAAPLFAPAAQRAFFPDPNVEPTGFLRSASIPHRLEVWSFVSEKITQKPLLGWGVDATRFLYSDKIMRHMNTNNVLHPHNAVLQIWVEYGFTGILLAIGFVIYLLLKIDHLPPLLQRYYTMLFIVFLSILSTGYGLWQAWLLGMIFTVCAASMMVVNINGLRKNPA